MLKTILFALVFTFPASFGDVENGVPPAQVQSVAIAAAQIPLAAIATIAAAQNLLEVTIEVSVEQLPDKRARIHGTTNLPTGTVFTCSVEESAQGGFYGQSSCSVTAGGSFTSEPFGPTGGLSGDYVAKVWMNVPSQFQPDNVNKVTGTRGEMLSGPLIGEPVSDLHKLLDRWREIKLNIFEMSVSTEKEFTIGGEQGVKAQTERLEQRLRVYNDMLKKVVALHARLLAAPDSGFFEKYWEFAIKFRLDTSDYKSEIERVEPAVARNLIRLPIWHLTRMFLAIASENSEDYDEASSEYTKNLQELELFISGTK